MTVVPAWSEPPAQIGAAGITSCPPARLSPSGTSGGVSIGPGGMVNLGSGGSWGEAVGPVGATAAATPVPPGWAPTLGPGLDPAVAAVLPGGGCTGTAGLGVMAGFFAGARSGVVVDGTALGTVVEGEVPATTVVVVTSGVGVGGVGEDGTVPAG